MAVNEQVLTDRYGIYNGDSAEWLPDIPDESVGMSIYSPPFATESGGCLYNYSSSVRDLSNSRTYQEFFEHLAAAFLVKGVELYYAVESAWSIAQGLFHIIESICGGDRDNVLVINGTIKLIHQFS